MTRSWNRFTTNSQDSGQPPNRGMNESNTLAQNNVGIIKDMPTTEEATMPEVTISDVESVIRKLHATEPILVKSSHIYGEVKVYPPDADPSEWAVMSWLLTTEHDQHKEQPGLRKFLRADAVHACFERPHFIGKEDLFVPTP